VLICAIGCGVALIPVRKLPIGFIRSVVTGMLASLSLVSISLLPRDIIATIVGFPLFAVVVANIVNVVILSDFLEREKSRLRI
ncbi:hypothetical protein, partial [Enterobacter hormaechei]